MDGEEQIVTQMGLLLSQVRYARIALENIERATTRYAGIAVGAAGPGAAPLGAPPLIDGALKVYVVNIDDLTAGGPGIGDVLAGAIGGAGRFLGGFAGGVVGGAASSITLPWMLHQVRAIVETLDRILARIGPPRTDATAAGGAGPSIMSQLGDLTTTLRQVAEVFRAASGGPPAGGAGAPAATRSVQGYLDLARALSHVVNGLILLVPLLTGALAALLVRLDDIKLAIVDMLQFALRNVLVLRAAVLAVVLDTLSLAGRLVVGILGLVAGAVDAVLASVLRVIHAGLETMLTALRVASTGLKGTIDSLMLFLRDGLGALLIFLGNLRIFRLAFHLAEVLPLILPAWARIKGTPLNAAETKALAAATAVAPPSGAGPTGPVPLARFPDLAATILSPAAQAGVVAKVDALGRVIRAEARAGLDAVGGAMGAVGERMRSTIGTLDAGLDVELTDRLGRAKGHAQQLASALQAAEEVSRARPATGLEAIAKAYEDWLSTGGLRSLMTQLEEHFRATPVAAGRGTIAGSVVGGVVDAGAGHSVVVEIGEVTIDLGEVPQEERAGVLRAGFDPETFMEWRRNLEERSGIVPVTDPALA